ncbi:MAG TPA: glycosyltransferase family 4 protein [Gemmatimonadaceae bacterium]
MRAGQYRRKLRAVKLCLLHVDTERGWRGGERQALWLARELGRRGHLSIVAARTGEPLHDCARAAGLPTVACDPAGEADLLAAWRLHRVIRAEGIDIVHAHTAHAVAIAALATLGMPVPLVVSRRVDFRLRNNAGTRWKYGRASMLIAISRAVAGVLEASGMAGERIRVVPDGVDMDRVVAPATSDVLASLGVRGSGPLVVQVSQLVGHKDPLNFVRAMARARELVPSIAALLVGDGPLRAAVEAEVQSRGLTGVVHVAGYRADADALLAAADVATLSSSEEGMGSVLLDALAFGLPVAATRAGGIPEVITDGVSGLLAPPRDPAALGEAIARLVTDPELRARLRGNARARAVEFSVERMTDRTIEVYEEVLNGTGRLARTRTVKSSSSASVTRAP